MYKDQKVIVVLPAYNAEKTLEKTVNEIDQDLVDEIVIVDDKSSDNTIEAAAKVGINHIITVVAMTRKMKLSYWRLVYSS